MPAGLVDLQARPHPHQPRNIGRCGREQLRRRQEWEVVPFDFGAARTFDTAKTSPVRSFAMCLRERRYTIAKYLLGGNPHLS